MSDEQLGENVNVEETFRTNDHELVIFDVRLNTGNRQTEEEKISFKFVRNDDQVRNMIDEMYTEVL